MAMYTLDYYRRILSKEAINELPMASYEGPVQLVRTESDLREALDCLHKEQVLGFDTETRPCFQKGKAHDTSLVQLAGQDMVFLVQLTRVPFNEALAALLGNAKVLKVGVAIREDMRLLQKLYPFNPAGLVDLGEMARKLGIKTQGLRTLAANLMDIRISKGAQCSNWENIELSAMQVRYAATDAWIGRELHLRLVGLGGQIDTSEPAPKKVRRHRTVRRKEMNVLENK